MADRPHQVYEPQAIAGLALVFLIVSGIAPHDRFTWWLEVAPIFIGLVLGRLTYSRFPLSPLLYRLLIVHALILAIGGHYTYARVPVGYWFQDLFELTRNHYDRLGHLAQGFVPAIFTRELLLRTSTLRPGRWLFFLCVCVPLAFSASYELLEWWTAVLGGEEADAFLGTQGDVWDTQWDMFLALLGALSSLVLLGRVHDRSLAKVVADELTKRQQTPRAGL